MIRVTNAVLEPGYFSSQEHFAKILASERVYVADNVRFRKKSLFSRTKIRNPQSWQWLSIPLRPNQRKNPIYLVETADLAEWKHIHLRGLAYNYRTSPYFEHYEFKLEEYFAEARPNLGQLTLKSIELILEMLGMEKELILASQMSVIPQNMEDLLFSIPSGPVMCGEDDWWNVSLEQDRRLAYSWSQPSYHQNYDGFIPRMSVLDLIFNHGPESKSILLSGIKLEA